MAYIEIRGLKKSFGKVAVIHDFNLSIEQGERIVFVGPSGCGKSTLLRIICGIEEATSGTIHLDGTDVTQVAAAKRGFAMVFQNYALYPHMTVARNIGFGMRMARLPKAQIAAKVAEISQMLQLDTLLDRLPGELSGGQRQRVAIGRALVRDPAAFLFDEPLSNLDAALRTEMRLEIDRLHREHGRTMIYVTHDQAEAMTLADRIVVLRDGKIEQVGTPKELYETPGNAFVASFLGSPKINHIGPEDLTLGRMPSGASSIGVRPEGLKVVDAAGALTASFLNLEYLGSEAFGYFETETGSRICARVPTSTDFVAGQVYHLDILNGAEIAFDEEGNAA